MVATWLPAMLWSMDSRDPNQPEVPVLPFDEVLELRAVVMSFGGEDAERLIAHYEATIDLLRGGDGMDADPVFGRD